MEHRPHSGPEQCKYCILAYINFLFGLKFKFYDIATFYVFVTGTVMEHRPHSGPEQCKYCILAYVNFLFGLKFKFYDIAYFLFVCYSYNSEKTGTYAEETRYKSMGSSTICRFL